LMVRPAILHSACRGTFCQSLLSCPVPKELFVFFETVSMTDGE
jgi:hypothetical protein